MTFETDHPFRVVATALKAIDDLDIPSDVRHSLLFGNARGPFRIKAPEQTAARS